MNCDAIVNSCNTTIEISDPTFLSGVARDLSLKAGEKYISDC